MACQKVTDRLIDYIEGTLTLEEEQEIRSHIETCSSCQRALEQQQDIMRLLEIEVEKVEVPHDLMAQVQEKINQQPARRRWKAFTLRFGIVAVVLSMLLFSTDLTTGMMSQVQQWWNSTIGNKLASGDRIPGEEVNISATDQNIRITITHVAADEYGTDLYYTIDDLSQQDLYDIEPVLNNIFFENMLEVWGTTKGDEISKHTDTTEQFKGKLSLSRIIENDTVLKLSIGKMALISKVESTDEHGLNTIYNNVEQNGNWQFEIPVTKGEIKTIDVKQSVEVDGILVTIDTIKLAPTTTLLEYSYQTDATDQTIEDVSIGIEKIEVGGMPYYKSSLGMTKGSGTSGNKKSVTIKSHFEASNNIDPSEIIIYFGAINRNIKSEKVYPIDIENGLPQTFDYHGSTISVDNIEVGKNTHVDLGFEDAPDVLINPFEIQFRTNINGEEHIGLSSGNFVFFVEDRDGNRFTYAEYSRIFYMMSAKVHYTNTRFNFQHDGNEDVIPTHIIIDGYRKTDFLDETVTIKLK